MLRTGTANKVNAECKMVFLDALARRHVNELIKCRKLRDEDPSFETFYLEVCVCFFVFYEGICKFSYFTNVERDFGAQAEDPRESDDSEWKAGPEQYNVRRDHEVA